MIELSEVRQWGEVKEGTLAQAEQIRSKTQTNVADMIRDKEVQDMLEQHDLLKQLALGRNNFLCEDMVSEEEKEVPIQDSVVWDRAEQEELDELPCIDVVWDKVLLDVTTHESLLQKLVMGTEDLTDEKVKLSVKIVDAGQEFEEMSDKVAMWDDESPFCLDAQDGLLQQLALWWGVHG
ncbi:hypothetical protein PVAP13_8NG142400 [Panicum virgatum]|uniref:Uncharacterized protein n=1 Tax=Panicum virgatum TaxID=38727 RepID=A0A8T0P4T5_PANVG|nr:hypothetical protein PVAP13_8NG142400 [Panicum virgatum]